MEHKPDNGQAGDQIDVTIPMLAAGIAAYENWDKRKEEYVCPLADLAGAIYRAMEKKRRGRADAGPDR